MTLTHRVEAGHDVVAWLDRLMAVPKETTRDYQHLTQFQDELSAWAREPEWRRQLGAAFEENALSPMFVLRALRSATGRGSGCMTEWTRVAAWATPCSWNMENIPIPEKQRWLAHVARLYRDDMPEDGAIGDGSWHCLSIEAYMRHHVEAWDQAVFKLGGGHRLEDIALLERIVAWHEPNSALLRVALVAMEAEHCPGRLPRTAQPEVLKCLQHQRREWIAEVQRAYDAYALLHGYVWAGIEDMADCVACVGRYLHGSRTQDLNELPLPNTDAGIMHDYRT